MAGVVLGGGLVLGAGRSLAVGAGSGSAGPENVGTVAGAPVSPGGVQPAPVAAGAPVGQPERDALPPRAAAVSVPKPARPAAPPTAPARPSTRPAAPVVTEPVRLRIPRLKVDAAVQPVSVLPEGDLDVPADPDIVGWWSGSARAGGSSGSTVIDGHVDTARDGRGAFFELRTLAPGDRVELRGRDGRWLSYTVTGRRQYDKDRLPVTEVFGPSATHRVVLVTCGGRFDSGTRHYRDNVVVYAAADPPA